jgi:hypothetical protein
MRRRFLQLISATALLVLAATLTWIFWPRPQLIPGGFEKVKVGMTLAEVETVLGGPPGVYCSDRAYANYTTSGVKGKRDSSIIHEWVGAENCIAVWFNADGQSTGLWHGRTLYTPGYFDRVLGWFGWGRRDTYDIVEFTLDGDTPIK